MKNILKSIVTAFIIGAIFSVGIYFIDDFMLNKSYHALYDELKKASNHCFAVEGRYPPDLRYIQDHYGIEIDNRRFTVDYRRTSPDNAPDINISINKGGAFA